MEKYPSRLVVVTRISPEAEFLTVIAAPATTAPWLSSTVPLRVANIDCAQADGAAKARSERTINKNLARVILTIDHPPEVLLEPLVPLPANGLTGIYLWFGTAARCDIVIDKLVGLSSDECQACTRYGAVTRK